MALTKIKLLLKNGTQHIQDRLSEIQDLFDVIRTQAGDEVFLDLCKNNKETRWRPRLTFK